MQDQIMSIEEHEGSEAAALRERVRLLECVVENFPGGLLLFDSGLRLVFCNERQRRMLEYPDWFFGEHPPTISEIFWYNATRGEYGDGDPKDFVDERMRLVAKREEHVFERRRPNGTLLEVRGRPLEGGGFVTTYLDVTEQRRGQDALTYLANHDVMTNLPNRYSAGEYLKNHLANLTPGATFTVLFMDLDGFKPINDRFGHPVGDEILKRVAQRLSHSVREADFVARYGGDEFLIIMEMGTGLHEAEAMAARLKGRLAEVYAIGDLKLSLGASFGIALCPDDGTTVDTLVAAADHRLLSAKRHRSRLNHPPSDSVPPDRRLSR